MPMRSIAALVLAGVVSVSGADRVPPVSLHVETAEYPEAPVGELTPGSAFELRFAEPMVADSAVGNTELPAPILIKPPIAGTWIWVSSQSGVFQPKEAPALGMSYQVSLRSDLRTAAGKEFRGSLKETFRAPKFRLKVWYAQDYWEPGDATANPKIGLCFASDVELAGAQAKLWFINDAKVRIEAVAEHVDIRKTNYAFPSYRSDDKSNLTWAEDFEEFRNAGAKEKPGSESEEDGEVVQKGGPVFKNQLTVKPAKPLPPGVNWKLIVGKGLPGVADQILEADVPIDIGTNIRQNQHIMKVGVNYRFGTY